MDGGFTLSLARFGVTRSAQLWLGYLGSYLLYPALSTSTAPHLRCLTMTAFTPVTLYLLPRSNTMASVPPQNQAPSANITTTWVPSPDVRGTATILYSCLMTIFSSTVIALHLDITPTRTRQRERIWNMALWVLLAILAPEAIVYNAFIQLRMVVQFRKRMAELLQKNKESLGREKFKEESVKVVFEALQSRPDDVAGKEASSTKRYTV